MSSATFVYTSTGGAGQPANAVYTTPGTGYAYTTNGTGAGNINWGVNSGSYTIATDPNLTGTSLKVKGDAQFEGDVTFEGDIAIKGKSIKESLLAIEERLAILHPNEELENRWDNLRELRKQYMELEAEIIEKEKMWAILKK
jgi:hypothetical protein